MNIVEHVGVKRARYFPQEFVKTDKKGDSNEYACMFSVTNVYKKETVNVMFTTLFAEIHSIDYQTSSLVERRNQLSVRSMLSSTLQAV